MTPFRGYAPAACSTTTTPQSLHRPTTRAMSSWVCAFSADTDGQITGVRSTRDLETLAPTPSRCGTPPAMQLATAQVTNESTTGWQKANFAAPVSVTAGATYVASYRAPVGRYSYTVDGLRNPLDKSPLHTINNAESLHLRVGRPDQHFDSKLLRRSGVHCRSRLRAHCDIRQPGGPVDIGTRYDISRSNIRPINSAGYCVDIAHRQRGNGRCRDDGYFAVGPNASFTPSSSLAQGKTYTVTVTGAKNLGGTPMATPFVSTFTTSGPTACPCSLLSSSATPAVSDSGDASPITVGLRFTADIDGCHHRDPLLPRCRQHGSAHRNALFRCRSATRLSDFPDNSTRLADGELLHTGGHHAGATYVAKRSCPSVIIRSRSNFFANPVVNSPLTGTLGTYSYGSAMRSQRRVTTTLLLR